MTPAYSGGTLRVVTSTREGQIKLYANKCVGRDCVGGTNEKRPGKGVYTDLSQCDSNSDDSFNGASLSINVDPHQLENSVAYIVGVHGVSAHSEYTVTALVTGSHGHSLLMLQAGSAVNDFVEKNQFSYYRFTLSESHKDLTFIVTPFSGDPDIYVSTTYPYPNRTHYTWSHRSRAGTLSQLQSPILGLVIPSFTKQGRATTSLLSMDTAQLPHIPLWPTYTTIPLKFCNVAFRKAGT